MSGRGQDARENPQDAAATGRGAAAGRRGGGAAGPATTPPCNLCRRLRSPAPRGPAPPRTVARGAEGVTVGAAWGCVPLGVANRTGLRSASAPNGGVLKNLRFFSFGRAHTKCGHHYPI